MHNNSLKDLLKDTQKKYHLSKKELENLRQLLHSFPDALPEWEALTNKTPAQAAHHIAQEFCARFPDYSPYSLKTSPSFYLSLMKPYRSWRELEDGLQNLARFLLDGPAFNFCERTTFIVYGTLRRRDMYGQQAAKKKIQSPSLSQARAYNGSSPIKSLSFHSRQCKHCWRTVYTAHNRVSKKQHLCPLHDYPSSHPSYRARSRLVSAYRAKHSELRQTFGRAYIREYIINTVEYIQFLVHSPQTPCPNFAAYLQGTKLPLNSAKDILQAFFSMGTQALPRLYEKQIDELIDYSLSHPENSLISGFTIDFLAAEAWLEVAKNCKYP